MAKEVNEESGSGFYPFSSALLDWYDRVKRDLPWRGSTDPYQIWVSEIMLQQTRVDQGIGYYRRFLARFPDVQSLAGASQQDVLSVWQGLGYYNRALNMHKAAQIIFCERGGFFPLKADEWRKLPGVGAYTAAAVGSIAFGDPQAAVDGNVLRVISRLTCEPACISDPKARGRLSARAQLLLCKKRPGDFNQAMMELGALVCIPGRPKCERCPVSMHCRAYLLNQTQLFPVVAPKSPPKEVSMWYWVYFNQNGIFLRQRGNGSIWRQMWEFMPVMETQYRDLLSGAGSMNQEGSVLSGDVRTPVFRNDTVDSVSEGGTADVGKVDDAHSLKIKPAAAGSKPINPNFRVMKELERSVEHRLTHRLLRVSLLPVECGVGFTIDSLTFVEWNELKNYPIPVVFARYLRLLNTVRFFGHNKLIEQWEGSIK